MTVLLKTSEELEGNGRLSPSPAPPLSELHGHTSANRNRRARLQQPRVMGEANTSILPGVGL